MCGIVGGFALSKEELEPGLVALKHRGPDDRGVFEAGNFAAGITRLAILDRENGQQPFVSLDGRFVAIADGEIYNWKELRKELKGRNYTFRTECDCEILPAAWAEWGSDMVSRFQGMFALAVYDKLKGSLFLARDRCGEKPLYLATEGPLRFASEIKALSAVGVSLQPDATRLSDWLSLRYLPEPHTMFQGIETLPAAHHLTIDANGEHRLERYWLPPAPDRYALPISEEKAVKKLDRLTRSSVELALQADVPIAAYLSSGVDSSLLTHYIRDLGGDVTTVSLGFGGGSDETSEARTFAESMGFTHESVQLNPDSLDDLSRVIGQMERPVGDALILAFDKIASHTTSLSCKVALGGEGPDEHFAGYSFQRAYVTAKKIGSVGRSAAALALKATPSKVLDFAAKFPASLGASGRQKVANYLRDFSSNSRFDRITGLHRLFEPDEISALLHPDLGEQLDSTPDIDLLSGSSPLDTALRSQYRSWLQDWSLIRQDKNTMAHSLEYRAPFLNHRIIDFAFTLPDDFKLYGSTSKYIWRELAARYLPVEATQRTKQPLYLPLEHPSWREPLLELARDVLSPENVKRHGWINPDALTKYRDAVDFLPLKQLASLIILHLWLDQFSK